MLVPLVPGRVTRAVSTAASPCRSVHSAASRGATATTSNGLDLAHWEVQYSDLTIMRPLGEGSFGRVSSWLRSACASPPPLRVRPPAAAAAQPSFRLLTLRLQVFLATHHETMVAVKLLLSADEAADVARDGSSILSVSSPIMQALHKESQRGWRKQWWQG